ncbi:MAG: AbrB/MazE/SpoVT family DNA-binding domain-containing protein [Candidatus Aminicenantes bacterium]|nr:AbrB/MazE/SpoVT family DNA-binding domain-containing protein [Candidatus Aminicenantes bacterium]
MEVPIVQIGNSKGIRIPQSLLKQYNLKNKVILDLEKEGLLIKPKKTRAGWEESFKEMAQNKDDELILGDFKNTFDEEEWVSEDE